MLEFKKIGLEHKQIVKSAQKISDYQGCEYSFGNMFIWQSLYNIRIAVYNNTVFLSTGKNGENFNLPLGSTDIKRDIDILLSHSRGMNIPLKLTGITAREMGIINELYPDRFEFVSNRDYSDYIYNSHDLINLSGKKYHKKRNHIRKIENKNWRYEDINRTNLAEVYDMNDEWCRLNNCQDSNELSNESCAVRQALDYFFELDFEGGLIRLEDRVVAYTIGEPLNSNTYNIHIEKAFYDVSGAYPLINREFAARKCSEFTYINREEDMGNPGLRKAKLSYYPAYLLDKYIAYQKV